MPKGATDWKVGDKIVDRFIVHKVLSGEGKTGMSIVYVCYDPLSEGVVALKTYQPRFVSSPEAKAVFKNEANTWINLDRHPHIVRAISAFDIYDRLFVELEYIPPDIQGRNALTHFLGCLSFEEILRLSIQFCYGMEYAYSKGLYVHGDIKPHNIMVTSDMDVKITDFGLAESLQFEPPEIDEIFTGELTSLSIYHSGTKPFCGTLPYIAPEQFDGMRTRRTDVYAFGVVLYQMITGGRFPFSGNSVQDYEKLHKTEEVPRLTSDLFPIVSKCLQKDPEKRYMHFNSLQDDLDSLYIRNTGRKMIAPKVGEFKAWEMKNKGSSLMFLDRYNEALACYNEVIRLDPSDIKVFLLKGYVLTQLNDYQAAIECFDRFLAEYPNDVDAWNSRGSSFMFLKRYEEAIASYERALEIDPNDPQSWAGKAEVLFRMKNYEKSISYYNRSLSIKPRNKRALWTKGLMLLMREDFAGALECFEAAIDIEPDEGLWHMKGIACDQLGRWDDAIMCFDNSIKLGNKTVDVLYSKAWLLGRLERFAEALECLDELLRLDFSHERAHELRDLIISRMNEVG